MAEAANVVLIEADGRSAQHRAKGLRAAGFRVSAHRDASALNGAAAGDAPCLVLCACATYSPDGVELLRGVRAACPAIPVILFAERFREVSRLRYMEQGAFDVIPAKALLETVRGTVDRLVAAQPATAKAVAAEEPPQNGQMYFRLTPGEVGNAIQFLCGTSRAGELLLTFPSGTRGRVFIARDTIVHAEFDGADGVDALARMLTFAEMELRFFEGREAPAETIGGRSVSQVLVEASFLADELKTGETD
jgi:CheY-like chemotaxis protein